MNDSAPELTEEAVIASVRCPQCNAAPGRACKGSGRLYESTRVHRGRWLRVERDLRSGRAKWPPPRA